MKRFVCMLALMAAGAFMLAAQTDAAATDKTAETKDAPKEAKKSGKEEKPFDFKLGLGIGSSVINGETWTRINLLPEIAVWKFGIAFDIEVFVSPQGSLSSRGWDFSGTQAVVDTLLRKFYYIRFNEKDNVVHGDEYFFGKFGVLTDVTIGEGLIMKGYANTLGYPVNKQLGFEVAVGNISDFKFGLEGMVNNIADLASGGPVVGTRLFFSPLGPTKTAVVEKLQIGFSFVGDVNQYSAIREPFRTTRVISDPYISNYLATNYGITNATNIIVPVVITVDPRASRDFFGIFGADIVQPLGDNVRLYVQAAVNYDPAQSLDGVNNWGWGVVPGVNVFFKPIFDARVEFRRYNGYFEGSYFNYQYDTKRAAFDASGNVVTKDSLLAQHMVNGVYGSLDINLFILNVKANCDYLMPDGGGAGEANFEAHAGINKDIVKAIPVVKDYIGEAEAYYIKKHITKFFGAFDNNIDTIMGARAGIKLGGNTMFVYDYQLSFQYDQNGALQRNEKMSIGAVTVF